MGFIIEVNADDIAAASEPQGNCPPKDTYLAEITEFPDPEWKPGYQGIGRELANKVSFRLMDYEWEYPITGFFTWVREDKSGKQHYTFLNPESKSNALYTACFGEIPHTGTKVVGDAFLGKRIKIAIEPNKKGYPNITMMLALSARDEQRLGAAPEAPAAAPAAAPEPGNPERAARSSSRRTERLLKKISETAAGKGWTDDMVAGLADDEFGMTLEQMSTDELDELLAIIEDEEAINF